MKSLQVKRMKDDTFQRELELRKLRKKQNVSVSNVQNSMKKLIEKLKEGDEENDIVTPNSSDMSSQGGQSPKAAAHMDDVEEDDEVASVTISIRDIGDASNNLPDIV